MKCFFAIPINKSTGFIKKEIPEDVFNFIKFLLINKDKIGAFSFQEESYHLNNMKTGLYCKFSYLDFYWFIVRIGFENNLILDHEKFISSPEDIEILKNSGWIISI